MKYDVIIIGKGPAGLSAAIFTARAQLKTLVIGRTEKSQLIYAHDIYNYFGFPEGIKGKKLLELGAKQAKKWGAEIIEDEVVDIKKGFKVKTSDKEHEAKAIIIATGIPIQWAGIKGEKELLGKGVHTCPNCDGPMYKGKKLAVIGNGDYAAEDALELTNYTKDVTIISHGPKFTFNKKFEQELKKNKIKLKNARVKEFIADKFLKKITFEDGSEEAFDGAYLACGTAGATTFASKLGIELKEGLIKTDENGMTNVPGIFAAGNCMGACRQIAKNVGDGCNAGVSTVKFLKAKDIFMDYAK
ncbi:MAG: NAD(P)/FAD-dependent oxidoreductase [Candidatus Woesearchaeota archaeon]|nr:NAD(P)/FAD-dependent oxidoreductase [Candidatus Woesearchaeota archaeon]